MATRNRGTHIREDGTPKRTFDTEESAVWHANRIWESTGKPCNVYRCWMNPEHYHIGGGVPDLKEKQ